MVDCGRKKSAKLKQSERYEVKTSVYFCVTEKRPEMNKNSKIVYKGYITKGPYSNKYLQNRTKLSDHIQFS